MTGGWSRSSSTRRIESCAGRVAQWESARFTRERSLVQAQPCPSGFARVLVSGRSSVLWSCPPWPGAWPSWPPMACKIALSERLRRQPHDPGLRAYPGDDARRQRPASPTTDRAGRLGPCGSPASRPQPGQPIGNEAVLAVERLCARVRVGHPQCRRLLGSTTASAMPTPYPCRGRLYTRRARTVASPTSPRRPRAGRTSRSRPAGHPARPQQRGSRDSARRSRGRPKPLPGGQEGRVIENCARHEPSVGLLPAPEIHARLLRDVLDPGRANRHRGPHRRIVAANAVHGCGGRPVAAPTLSAT